MPFFFLCFPSFIYADYFHPYGDCSQNRFFDTLGFGIESLANEGNCPNCLQFNIEDVRGSDTEYLLESVTLNDLTYPDFSHGLIRRPNLHSSVSLPPQSTVSFLYWYRNDTGEGTNISSLGVFLSKSPLELGDLRRVLDIEGVYEEPSFNILTWSYKRSGILKRYEGLGLVNSNASGSIVIDSVTVSSPLIFEKWEAQIQGDVALVRVYVKNISNLVLPNIEYKHSDFFLKRDFLANEEYVYEYSLDMESKDTLGYSGIYNPNVHKECAVHGEHMESYIVGDSAILFGVREDGNFLNYAASRVKPFVEDFCVTRIAYRLYSSEMVLKQSTQEEVISGDEQPTVVQESFVLGVSNLPKTAKFSLIMFLPFIFVVVVVLVWYYLKRKI